MVPGLRARFNAAFTTEGYQRFLTGIRRRCGVPIEFPLSETPCFLPAALVASLEQAARDMIGSLLGSADYLRRADAMVPERFRMPRGQLSEALPTFIQVDFGLVRGTRSGLVSQPFIEGRLVELQAFPSLYGFQLALAETARDEWGLGGVASVLPGTLDRDRYLTTVGAAICGGHDPAEVVLMEIEPERQKTRPDFAVTEALWGVRAIDVRAVTRDGRQLFYDRDGRRTRIRRIYNRVIPDELTQKAIALPFDYRDDLDVEWAGGPDWFFRISKFSIPFLTHPWVPKTMFLNEAEGRFEPGDDRWLLKPLFSYAGGGIIFGPTRADIDAIPAEARHLYVLQERVSFTPVIQTPDGDTQAEIRMMFVRSTGRDYQFVLPLVRMGRGRMMGVDHNKGLRFVGASAALIVHE
jgi:hypothetical protein